MASIEEQPLVERLHALAYILLGVGFFIAGVYAWRKASLPRPKAIAGATVKGRLAQGDGLGSAYSVTSTGPERLGESLAAAMARTKGAITSQRKLTVGPIEDRVELIRKMILRGGENHTVREQAAAVLSQKRGGQWKVAPKDYDGEARAMFRAVTDPSSPLAVRYTRDHPTIDVFTQSEKTEKLRIGDCDDLVIRLGSLLVAVGHEPEMVTIQAKGSKDWSHIFLRVPRGDGVKRQASGYTDPAAYLVLDPSMAEYPAGWEPPGLTEVLRHGGAAGIVEKARVFPVLKR